MRLVLVSERTFRIGWQALWLDQRGRWYVSIRNRSYRSIVPIPPERAPAWLDRLGAPQPTRTRADDELMIERLFGRQQPTTGGAR